LLVSAVAPTGDDASGICEEHFAYKKPLSLLWAVSEPLAVILSFMADTKHGVLIHGSWSRGEQLAPARAAFEERGYTAHTPTLRHHELPSQEGALKIDCVRRRADR
jgi:hypothetical protein